MEFTSKPYRSNSDVNDYQTSDNLPLLRSGIRATVGNRRKSIDITRFRAQPDEEQNRGYGDGDEFNPDRTTPRSRRFARMKRETMSCKRGSDEVNERRRSERERVEDGYGMGRSIHEDGEQFKRRSDDEEDVSILNLASTDVHDGACFTPNIHMIGYDREDQEEPIGDQKDHNDSIEQTKYYDSGGDCNDKEDEDSYVFVCDMQDDVPMTGTVHEDKNIMKRTVRSKEDESRIREQETEENNHELQVSVLENVFMHRQKRNRDSVIHFSDKERKALVTEEGFYTTEGDGSEKSRSQDDEIQGTIADQSERNTRLGRDEEHAGKTTRSVLVHASKHN
ncbi:hypothetical protein Hdeb2414_s0009g00325431 [Helianthus debilis subsp. tardiflorus]